MAGARRVRVFLNSNSGAGGVSPDTICQHFVAHHCVCEISTLDHPTGLAALAQRDSEDTVWVAAGGDGTVNAVARAIAGTARPLGILPVGTLNHFAHDLGLPLELEAAIALIATGEPRRVDAAEVNGITFVNNSSLGVYPAMVLDRDRMKKGGGNKWWSMVVASGRAFLRFRCLKVEVEIDGGIRHYTTPLLFVGNNVYSIEGGTLGRRERLDQGCLSLFLVPSASRAAMLRLFLAALLGVARKTSQLEEFTVSGFTVVCHGKRMRVSFDGEVRRIEPPLHYTSRPGALCVIAPTPPSAGTPQ